MQLGFLSRTPRGRTVTRLTYEHLGLPFNDNNEMQQKIDFYFYIWRILWQDYSERREKEYCQYTTQL
jgi:hypothetical protein